MNKADLLPEFDYCGLETIEYKISGGDVARIDEHSWIALLKYRDSKGEESYGCHGNLINRRYVLTAAHCVYPNFTFNKNERNISSVVLGEYDLRNETDCIRSFLGEDCAEKKEISVESYYIYPDYNITTNANDIALIRMKSEVDYSDFIKPIYLPPVNLISPFSETLWITGWGTNEKIHMNPIKLKAKFELNKKNSCIVRITRTQLCASSQDDSKTCPGDSGGPLMMRRKFGGNFRYFLIGVDSLGSPNCAFNLKISVYTKVSSYVEWIITNLQK